MINIEKLKQYIEEEMILEFETEQDCLKYFNIYDFHNFKTVDEMKAHQGIYGFGYSGKWYHIEYDRALDIYE